MAILKRSIAPQTFSMTFFNSSMITSTDQGGLIRKALVFQLFILRLVGLRNITKREKHWDATYVLHILRRIILLAWIGGGWVCFGFNMAVSIQSFLESKTGSTSLLDFFTLLPYTTITFKAASIPTLLLFKLPLLEKLLTECAEHAFVCFTNTQTEKLFLAAYRWRRQAMVFAVGIFTLQIVWEVAESFQYRMSTNKTYASDGVLYPLKVKFFYWQYIIMWAICCTALLFVGYQIYTFLVVFGAIIGESCDALCQDLRAEVNKRRASDGTPTIYKPEEKGAAIKIITIKQRYLRLCDLCDEVSHCFGWIMVICYGMDLVTCLGFVAEVAQSENQIFVSVFFDVIGALFASASATVFFWPMVCAQEKGLKVTAVLHDLIGQVELCNYTTDSPAQREPGLIETLITFLDASKDKPLMFHASEVFHITRSFIFHTFAIIISFVVVAKEILGKDAQRALIQESVNSTCFQNFIANSTRH